MTGNEPYRVVLQPRDLHLLREIAVMRVVDREQAQIVGGFTTIRRTNKRLLALTRQGLVKRFFLGTRSGGSKALYAVSEKAARYIGAPPHGPRRRRDEVLTGEYFVEHQLQINRIYCALKHPKTPSQPAYEVRWQTIVEPITPTIPLIPDGYLEVKAAEQQFGAFLEVDLGSEPQRVWKAKVDSYLVYAASGEFERRFHQSRFRVLVIANSRGRLESLRALIAAVTERVFWFATLEDVHEKGVWAPIWLRPKSDSPQTLLK